MVPVSLLLSIASEIACYLAIARYWFGAGWGIAILGALGGLLGLRAGINGVGWLFAARYGSPPPLGVAGRLRLIVGEYLAFLLTFVVVLPVERLWWPADRLPAGGGRPLLLVHGYGCSRGVWWLLRRRLEAAGHTVATVSLFPSYTSIGKLVPQLNQRIEEVCAATSSRQLTLIGHSMGGLVCRSYLARHGSARVDQLITLATPHAGTELARLGLGQNAREMEPGSLWLRDMAGEQPGIPLFSLRNPWDNGVMPPDNQRLPEARDIELPPVGHVAMLYDEQIARILLDLCQTKGKSA
ncbi:MAG: alpha/beta fold hydrolase [Azonexus sp.]|uniref:esterase/lipase family protein n=1 Tax=Azonexus sp. TaxID=1872668 RepID=UPI002832DF72|nr:alpha/beta fold hydrolase [Azonexus sp.]MDR0776177.1 alpha/beta fold hydrolase [Azonexus sp.]